ncbi:MULTISPECIES: hypothetical protein [unclassified Mesorhizobium]|uniref:hypothetical protein n=1 Tax=unclassified Mesorhizobium TaxID=325217 RepID=UPI0018C9F8FA|nr:MULTISPECIES: hypothetical protein [unclassified Mesorhizobium]WJI48324.1 hypothetical protein NL532_18320 [Mesorhizobium sp. C120A]WJI60151.1 hypothetical protein NLY33_20660 [Mesorhizobium sp. C432A]
MATIMHSAPRMFGERGKGVTGLQEQFQEKCETVFRPELRENKEQSGSTFRRNGEPLKPVAAGGKTATSKK